MNSMYVSTPERYTFEEKCPRKVIHSEKPKSATAHGRVTQDINADIRVSDYEARVYIQLAIMERGGWVTAGLRLIAESCNKSVGGVAKAINRLITNGYVERNTVKRGQRAAYRLTSSIFHAKVEQPASRKVKHRRKVVLLPCAKCSKSCRPSMPDGLCSKCLRRQEMRKIAEDVVRKDRRQTA